MLSLLYYVPCEHQFRGSSYRILNGSFCSQVPRTEAPAPDTMTPQEPWPGESVEWDSGREGKPLGAEECSPSPFREAPWAGGSPYPGLGRPWLEPLSLVPAGPPTPSPTSRPPWAVDPAFAERYAPDKTSTVLTRHSQPATPTPLQNRTSIVQAASGGQGSTPVCHQCHKVIRWVALCFTSHLHPHFLAQAWSLAPPLSTIASIPTLTRWSLILGLRGVGECPRPCVSPSHHSSYSVS